MKNLIFCLLFSIPVIFNPVKAQNLAINSNGALPDASSMVDITSTSKGFLAPRMTTAQQNAISSPAKGLLIYNTTTDKFMVNTGTPASPVWIALTTAASGWGLTGNSGTTPVSNFIGTSDNADLAFRTNNTQRMLIDVNGSVGIGSNNLNGANAEKLLVDAGTTTSVNAIVGKGSINSYLQLNIQNNSSGANASSDVVATANNGDETSNFVDMGINGGSYTGGIMGSANDGYLYTMGNNFLVGTGNANKSLVFMTGGTSQSSNERMRIDGTGNVGIGTNAPTSLLHVANSGTSSNTIAQFLSPNLAANTASYFKLGKSLSNGDQADIMYSYTGANNNANYLGFGFYGKPISMVLTNALNVGIGTITPNYKLQVTAASNPLQLGGLQTGTNSDSILTVQSGVVKMLHPSSLATSSTNAWALVGNTGSATTKLGTTGNFDLPIITNNTTKMTVTSGGRVGIGSTDFDDDYPEQLLVDVRSQGASGTKNLIGAYANKNDYVQIGVQNTNSGQFASSDIVATADNGTNTTNYIDMGINSSGYSNNASNILNRPNVGYLYTNATADFFIGNGAPDQDLIIFTNNGPAGNTTANGFEAMRIDGNGNVGIGGTSRNNSGVKTTNAEKLVVHGNIVPRNSGSGTLGTSTYKWNAVYATNGTIQTSDARMKTSIIDLNYGLNEILKMRPVTFYWKTTPDSNKKVGLIAQEVKKIVPEVVIGDEEKETLGLNYAELVPVLINAVKEQQKEIEELKARVQKLEK